MYDNLFYALIAVIRQRKPTVCDLTQLIHPLMLSGITASTLKYVELLNPVFDPLRVAKMTLSELVDAQLDHVKHQQDTFCYKLYLH